MKMLSLRPRLFLFLAILAAPAHAVVIETTPSFPNAITPRGPKGDMGCSVIPTNGAPAASVGRDCDWAFDAAAGKVYGPKITGQWGAGVVMSPVVAAQTFADRARLDREEARASATAAASSAAAAASAEGTATGVQSWFNGLAPANVLLARHGGSVAVSPDTFGAAGNGIADDRQAFLDAAASLGDTGGVIQLTCSKKYYISNVRLPHHVTLRGCLTLPDNPGGINTSQDYSRAGGIRLSGATAARTITTTKGSAAVIVNDGAGIVAGMTLTSPGVPGGAYVTQVSGTNITLSQPATVTSGATVASCNLGATTGSSFATSPNCDFQQAGIAMGAALTSTAFPAGTTVIGVGLGFVELSNAATATNANVAASFVNPANESGTFTNTILLGPAAGVEKILIYRAGMTFPAPDASAYAGTALRCGYQADGCFARDALVIGFADAFVSRGANRYSYANARVALENFHYDAVNGVRLEGSFDVSRLKGIHGWPFGTVGNGGAASTQMRSGKGLYLTGSNDGTLVEDFFDHGHAVGIDIEKSSGARLQGLFFDNYLTNSGAIGLRTGANTDGIAVGDVTCYSPEKCIVRAAGAGENMSIASVATRKTGLEAVRIDGGNLTIGNVDIQAPGSNSATAPFVVNSAASRVQVKGGLVTALTTNYAIKALVPLRTDLVDVSVKTDAGPGYYPIDANPATFPTIASSNTLTLPPNSSEFYLTGTTDVSTVAGGQTDGARLRLHVVNGLTFKAGGNIIAPGGEHAAPASSWVELSWNWNRSAWVLTGSGSETTTPLAAPAGQEISALMFGATPDGDISTQTGTSNTSAFNRALSACAGKCAIRIPPGVYVVDQPVFYSGAGDIDIRIDAGAYIVAAASWDKVNANGMFVIQSYGANEAAYNGTGGDPALRQSVRISGSGRFDCRNTRPQGTGAGSTCLRVNGNSFRGVYIEGIELSGTGFDANGDPNEWSPATGSDTGVTTMGGAEITLRNIKTYGFKDGGIYLSGDFAGACDSILIEGVYTDRANFGIAVKRPCKRVRIVNNQARRGTVGISLLYANSGATNGAPPSATIVAMNAVSAVDKAFWFQQQDRLSVYGNRIADLGRTDNAQNTTQACGFLLEGVTNSEFQANNLAGPQTLYPARFANNSTSFAFSCAQTFSQTIDGSPVTNPTTGNRFISNRSNGIYAGFVEADATQTGNFYDNNRIEGATLAYSLKGYTSQWREGYGATNFVRNGDFSVSRRGSSFAPAAATDTPIADSWWYRRTNNGVTITAGADATGDYLQFQRTAANATTTTARLWQQWPSDIVRKMAGKPVTCMYYAQAGADQSAASLNVAIWTGTGVNEVGANASFPTGQVGVNVPRGDTLSTSWKRYLTTTYTLPANASEALIIFSWAHTGTAGANDWIRISKIRCAVGGYVPDQGEAGFDLAGRETELPKLLQYLQAVQIQTMNGTKSVQFSPPMFAAPTVSATVGSVANATPDSVDLTHTSAASTSITAFVPGF